MFLSNLAKNILVAGVGIVLASNAFGMDTYRLTRTTPNREPISFFDHDNHPAGFEKEIMEEIVKHAGIEVEEDFVDSMPEAFNKLEADETDMVMSAVSITPQRMEIYGFSEAYFNAHPMTIISKDSELHTFFDLKNKRVAVREGTTHEKWMHDLQAEFPDTTIMPEKTSFLAVKDVIQDKADAVIGDDSYMINFAQRYKKYKLVYVIDNNFDSQDYGILISKDNEALKNKLDQALSEMKSDGTYESILSKWYSS